MIFSTDMKVQPWHRVLLWMVVLPVMIISCAPKPGNPISLASFTEASVSVSVSLARDSSGKVFLSATFTPPDGYHLYSKDLPATGRNGQGRPTRLELAPNSHVKALAGLTESVGAVIAWSEPEGLLVYPAGPVTLSLPIQLPAGNSWVKEEVKVSFMACTASQCKPPVEKIVAIRLPGADLFNDHSSTTKQ